MLHRLEPHLDAAIWHIAFSGGLDSTVLLHLLASLSRQQRLPPLRAIHIHHGLQAAADAWPAHCQAVCDSLGVPLTVLRVRVEAGASLEQAARQARYQAFEALLGEGEVLLTAQHSDDQAETLLFRLLRGAGVRGLVGMPCQRRLGRGWLLRPLLDQSRAQLEAYARAQGLSAIEDPSNRDLGFSRNYLRHQVLPPIEQRWPQAAATIARSAEHLREALGLLDELALEDLRAANQPGPFDWLDLPSLLLEPIRGLSPARQRNALQHWLASRTRLPDSVHWRGWEDLRDARAEAAATWALADGQLRRGAGRLWWLPKEWPTPSTEPRAWPDVRLPLLLEGNGTVVFQGPAPIGSARIAYRQGGETLEVPGRGRRDLKRLLNEAGVPGFVRARLPLLFVDGRLHAVANLAWPGSGQPCLHWSPRSGDQHLR
jgi:tRNA(Ile)-lysidine synthase